MTTQEKIAQMQKPRQERGDVFQLPDGTWGHRHDASGGFADEATARKDFSFSQDWYRGRA